MRNICQGSAVVVLPWHNPARLTQHGPWIPFCARRYTLASRQRMHQRPLLSHSLHEAGANTKRFANLEDAHPLWSFLISFSSCSRLLSVLMG
jgi:hypothetical protein